MHYLPKMVLDCHKLHIFICVKYKGKNLSEIRRFGVGKWGLYTDKTLERQCMLKIDVQMSF